MRLNGALGSPRGRLVVTVLILVIFSILGFSYLRKVNKGKSALIRWKPEIQALRAGENIFVPRMYEMMGTDDREAHPVPPHPAFRFLPPPDGTTFPHPPFATLQLYPYSYLSDQAAGMLWFILRALAFLFALKMIFSIVAEKEAAFTPLASLVVFLLCLRTAQSDLNHGNINLFILFWTTLAFWAYKFEKDFLAGLALAVGISLKVTPGLILVYFIYKRAWKATVATGLSLILLNLVIPSLVFGPDNTLLYSYTWYKGMVEPTMVKGNIDLTYINQSIQGVLGRLLIDAPTNLEHAGSLLALDHATGKSVIRVVLLGLLGVLAWTCRAPRAPRDNFFLSVEFSLVLLTMLYFNERSWKHHYVIAALPYAVWVYAIQRALQYRLEEPRPPAWISPRPWMVALGISAAMILLTSKDILGHTPSDYYEYYGGIFLSSFIIYVGLIVLARRAARAGHPRLADLLVRRDDSRPSVSTENP